MQAVYNRALYHFFLNGRRNESCFTCPRIFDISVAANRVRGCVRGESGCSLSVVVVVAVVVVVVAVLVVVVVVVVAGL